MLCAATFSNSYVKWRFSYMMLRFVAVLLEYLSMYNFSISTLGYLTSMDQISIKTPNPKCHLYWCLKGQCHEFFASGFFHESVSPQPQSIPLGWVFCENSRRYSQVKVHPWYRWHQWQILPPVSLVLLIPVENLLPVSTTPVANCHWYQWHWRQICHRCKRHRCQIMGTISESWQLQMNLKEKVYLYVNSTTQRCPKEIILKKETFMLEVFFHLPPVSTTPVANEL